MFRHPWGTSEDDLTGDFFGLMKYLPAEYLLVPFLGLIKNLYPKLDIQDQHIEESEILMWPDYEIPNEWREQFNRPDIPAEKRRSKYYIVPDAVIKVDDCVFVVEAEKSHSVEAEQLFQQYLVSRRLFATVGERESKVFNLLVNSDQIPPYSCHINAIDSKSGVSISPTDSIPRYIQKRAEMLGEACDLDAISRSYIWISWHHIGKLAEEVLNMRQEKKDQISQFVTKFLWGFKEMLDSEGFYPVRIFRADDTEEISIGDCGSIAVLKSVLYYDVINFNVPIEPSSIPSFYTLPEPATELFRSSINPENIQIITKEVSRV